MNLYSLIGFLDNSSSPLDFKTCVFESKAKYWVQIVGGDKTLDSLLEIDISKESFIKKEFKLIPKYDLTKGVNPIYGFLFNDMLIYGSKNELIGKFTKERIVSSLSGLTKLNFSIFSENIDLYRNALEELEQSPISNYYKKQQEFFKVRWGESVEVNSISNQINPSSDAQLIWNNCLDFVKGNIQPQAFKTWFEPIMAIKLYENALSIQVPNKFFYEWLEEHYVKLLKVALTKELGETAKLVYIIRMENTYGNKEPFTEKIPSSNRGAMAAQEMDVPIKSKNPELRNPFVIPGIRNIKIESQLNPNYNFDNFLEGDSNRLARSAGMAVANKPGGTSFNPLLVFGGVGLGKTHLAHAIGVEIKDKYPERTVLYISAEKFTQQYIESVKKNTRNDFIHFYQLIDVLIIDDVQFLSGKSGTQDVFFHIFNHLHQNGKQVILTSDKAPVDMQDIEQRLLSRFKWGLSAELQSPDYETRISILKNKLYRDGVEIPEDIIEYVAKHIKTNIRELEGAIISLIAQSTLNKRKVTIELAQQVVEKFVKNTKREVSIDYIQKVVSDYFEMDVATLQSKTRKRHIVQARQLAMFFAKKFTKASLASIGSQIGKRDHATVLHACKTVDNLADSDQQFRKYVEELSKKFN
tara:strand:+ start:5346 stop:7259 length:1914 start_codon:yes stop_codon:yes gene_type:complete